MHHASLNDVLHPGEWPAQTRDTIAKAKSRMGSKGFVRAFYQRETIEEGAMIICVQ